MTKKILLEDSHGHVQSHVQCQRGILTALQIKTVEENLEFFVKKQSKSCQCKDIEGILDAANVGQAFISPMLVQTSTAPKSCPMLRTTSLALWVLPRCVSLGTIQKWLDHFKSQSGVRMPQNTASASLHPSDIH